MAGNLFGSYLRLLGGFRQHDLERFAEEHDRLYHEARRTGDHGAAATHYYSVMADFLEAYYGTGWHFVPPEHARQRREDAIRGLHGRIARLIQHGPGRHALDLGCGIGDAMRTVALESGGAVTGLTIGQNEVDTANAKSREAGLDRMCRAVQGDFGKLPFEDASFDAAYSIYAYKYSVSLKQAFGEVARVLRPGGLFVLYDMVRTEAYDPDDPEHVRLLETFAYSTGMPPIHSNRDRIAEAGLVGFECLTEMDLGQRWPWYHFFERPRVLMPLLESERVKRLLDRAAGAGLVPRGFDRFYRTFVSDTVTSMVNAGRRGLLTGSSILVLRRRADD